MLAESWCRSSGDYSSTECVNHLLFADDSLLFFEAEDASATRIDELLRTYCNASGQRINMEKSSIFSVKEFRILFAIPSKISSMSILNR